MKENMCKFCRDDGVRTLNKPNEESIDLGFLGKLSVRMFIDTESTLVAMINHDTLMGGSEYVTGKINFCPMCGRDLRKGKL